MDISTALLNTNVTLILAYFFDLSAPLYYLCVYTRAHSFVNARVSVCVWNVGFDCLTSCDLTCLCSLLLLFSAWGVSTWIRYTKVIYYDYDYDYDYYYFVQRSEHYFSIRGSRFYKYLIVIVIAMWDCVSLSSSFGWTTARWAVPAISPKTGG